MKNVTISDTVQSLIAPASMELAALARKMKADGLDVIDLSSGQPDFPAPDILKKSAVRAIDEDRSHYTVGRGIPELREAVQSLLVERRHVKYDAEEEILITPGAKQAIFYALLALTNPGDEVMIPEPCWLSYADQIRMAGAVPVLVPTDRGRGFRPDRKNLDAARTESSRVLIVNSPCNPTGMVWTREEMAVLADFAVAHDLAVISDEIYEPIIFDGRECVSAAEFPGMKERTVLISGFSKSFAVTGWRLGYAAAAASVMSHLVKVHQHMATCANSIAQYACARVMTQCADDVERMRASYQQRRDDVYRRVTEIPFLDGHRAEGTFYAFLDIRQTGLSSRAVAEKWLKELRLAVVPGDAYGPAGEGYLRLSFAAPRADLEKAFDRIHQWNSASLK